MPQKTRRQSNPAYVTKAECAQISASIKEELKAIRTALVGEDMRGGLVKDVADLKKERSTTLEVVRSVVVPIIVAVATAIIVSLF